MRDEILEYLSTIHKAWHTRRILDHPEYVEWIASVFPNYDLKNGIRFLLHDLAQEPLCENCNKPLANYGKQCCSRKCASELAKQTGAVAKRLELAKKTNLKKYGVENPQQNKEIREKTKQTMMTQYGGLVSQKHRESSRNRAAHLNTKGRETLMEKYGVVNAGQLPGHSERCARTIFKKYGVNQISEIPHLRQRRESNRAARLAAYMPSTINIIGIQQAKREVYPFENDKINFLCQTCGTESSVPSETVRWRIQNTGTPCAKCAGINSGSSLKEQALADYITSLGWKIERNNRSIIAPLELDIFVPDQNIAIEFNGLFWHNDLRVSKDYHFRKYQMCKNKGVKLIQIFEDEWDYKQEIVKSRLAYALNSHQDRIFARKCSIEPISATQARVFVDAHHLQGYAPSTIKLGLFHNQNLIGVMTFSHPSKAKGANTKIENIWELSRFCTSTPVTGGCSKMIKYFIDNYQVDELFSYADLRWGSGSVYARAGLEYSGNTQIGYWYIDGFRRIHRYALRKQAHETKTEYESRLEQGYLRIWDCGHAKYVWKRKQSRYFLKK
jgi:hypothetical protein